MPGERLSAEKRDILAAQYATSAAESLAKLRQAKSLQNTLLDIIPENPLQEMAVLWTAAPKGTGFWQ